MGKIVPFNDDLTAVMARLGQRISAALQDEPRPVNAFTAAEAHALYAFAQAFQRGSMNADELRTIAEKAPTLGQAFIAYFGSLEKAMAQAKVCGIGSYAMRRILCCLRYVEAP